MAGIRALIGLAFSGSIGITLLILGCALPIYNNWFPFFVLIFYILCPLPPLIARRVSGSDGGSSNTAKEVALFLTSGMVISAYALPIVLARSDVIHVAPSILTLCGNSVIFPTILGFFIAFDNEDEMGSYNTW